MSQGTLQLHPGLGPTDMFPLQSSAPGKGKWGRRGLDLFIHSDLEPFSPSEVSAQGIVQAKLEWAHLHHIPMETLEVTSPCANGKHGTEGKGAS